MLLKLLLSFLVVACAADNAQAMALNDVSVLLPLPSEADFAQLLSPADQAQSGVLIPQALYQKFGRFVQGYDPQALYDQGFKVIGVRLDPCFTEGTGPQACRHQIRLVWQPVLQQTDNAFTTLDTALHAFYEFHDEREWQAIVQAWPRLQLQTQAVQVHPEIKAETLNGKFWQTLKAVIMNHCGEQKLVRLTAMTSNATSVQATPAIVWLFQGFDVTGPKAYVRMMIPRIGRTTQVLINTNTTHAEYAGDIQPAPPLPSWNEFLQDSDAAANGVDLKAVMDQAFANENPQRENPGTVDCVSCHVSQGVRHWGETQLGTSWNWAQDFPARYQSSLNLKNETAVFGTNRVRSFGYFGQDPVISQRLINETAAIVQSF